MVSAFGGSSGSLERRRRLMTLEEREVSDEILRDFGIVVPESPAEAESGEPTGERFLPRLISRQLWKHWVVLLPLFLLLTGLARGLMLETGKDSGAVAIARIAEGCTGILFALTAQLCLIIGWMRSQSTVDFRGSYRAWRWASAISGIVAVLTLTDTLMSLPDFVATLLEPLTGRLAASRLTLVLVPAILLLAPVLFRLIPDMGRCRTSQGLMVLGTLSLIGCVAIPLIQAISLDPALPAVLFLYGSCLVFAASMLHARHVMYISHDPPARRIRPVTPSVAPSPDSLRLSSMNPTPEAIVHSSVAEKAEEPPAQETPVMPALPAATHEPTVADQPIQGSADGGHAKHDKKKQKQKSVRKAG